MKIKMFSALLISLLICSFFSSPAAAEIFRDDFDDNTIQSSWGTNDDGTTRPWWAYNWVVPGVSVTEENGEMRFSGYPAIDTDALVQTPNFDGGGLIDTSVDFKVVSNTESYTFFMLASEVPEFNANPPLLVGFEFSQDLMGWYPYYSRLYNDTVQWDSYLLRVAYGDENTAFHRLRLTYDGNTGELNYYIDGILYATETVWLGDKVKVVLRVGSNFYDWRDIRFDNFYAEAVRAVEPPIDALEVSLGDITELEPTSEDTLFSAWSPDSTRIAFVRRDGTDPEVWNVWVKEIGSMNPAYPVTTSADGVFFYTHLCWSPDGSGILFGSQIYEQNIQQVRLANADGTGTRLLLGEEGILYGNPDVVSGPFGNQMVFTKDNDLYSIAIEPGGDLAAQPLDAIRLTDFPNPQIGTPRCSEDGDKIAFVRVLDVTDCDIYLIQAANDIYSGAQPIVDSFFDPRLLPITTNANVVGTPAISPDGNVVYFTEDTSGNYNIDVTYDSTLWEHKFANTNFDLFYANIESGPPVVPYRIFNDSSDQGVLSASPDGTMLCFTDDSNRDGDSEFDGNIYIASLIKTEVVPPDTEITVEDASGCSVTVPAGAVPPETEISIQTPFPGTEPSPETLPEGASLQTVRDFGPDGMVFTEPVLIKIYYDETKLGDIDETSLKIYYYDDVALTWKYYPESTVNTAENYVSAWVTHFSIYAVVAVNQLSAIVDIDPDSLNLKSKGKYITCYITLASAFNPENIDISSIMLNGVVPAHLSPYAVGDYNSDGIPDLMVKFDRDAVQATVAPGISVPITVTGFLGDGTQIEGTDYISVKDKGSIHYDEADPSSVIY